MLFFAWMNRLTIWALSSLPCWNIRTYLWSTNSVIAIWLLLALSVRIQPCLACFLSRRHILVLTAAIIDTITIIHAGREYACINICIILPNDLCLWIRWNLIFGCNSTCRFSSTRLRNVLWCQFSKSLSWWRICLLLIWWTIWFFSPL